MREGEQETWPSIHSWSPGRESWGQWVPLARGRGQNIRQKRRKTSLRRLHHRCQLRADCSALHGHHTCDRQQTQDRQDILSTRDTDSGGGAQHRRQQGGQESRVSHPPAPAVSRQSSPSTLRLLHRDPGPPHHLLPHHVPHLPPRLRPVPVHWWDSHGVWVGQNLLARSPTWHTPGDDDASWTLSLVLWTQAPLTYLRLWSWEWCLQRRFWWSDVCIWEWQVRSRDIWYFNISMGIIAYI